MCMYVYVYVYANMRFPPGKQIRRPSARRAAVLQRGGRVDGGRGVQVERADAVLQGPGHRVGAVGPALHPQVHEGPRRPAVGRARHHQEEEADLAPQGRRGQVPVQEVVMRDMY